MTTVLHWYHINFYPRSPCGERLCVIELIERGLIFLSTLSLRRATGAPVERIPSSSISIHALLAESDGGRGRQRRDLLRFLSTLSLRRATTARIIDPTFGKISIHALLAESDNSACCGVRRKYISIHALLAESDNETR